MTMTIMTLGRGGNVGGRETGAANTNSGMFLYFW
jgi:hypothetical protein